MNEKKNPDVSHRPEKGMKLFVESLTASPKGIALIAMVEAELLPKIEKDGEEGWDTTKFEVFWSEFSRYVVAETLTTTKKFLKKKRKGRA
jgi:hypothetical protein